MKYAIDCEMVGGDRKSILARVSLVDEYGSVQYDAYVKPNEPVLDYRTQVSGITASQLAGGKSFSQVKQDIGNIISGAILIGHSLDVDLQMLGLQHPEHLLRDVATYDQFQNYSFGQGEKPSLKDLARQELGLIIQQGQHSSVEDAKASMKLYKKVESTWK